jgi:hypothetical protein
MAGDLSNAYVFRAVDRGFIPCFFVFRAVGRGFIPGINVNQMYPGFSP